MKKVVIAVLLLVFISFMSFIVSGCKNTTPSTPVADSNYVTFNISNDLTKVPTPTSTPTPVPTVPCGLCLPNADCGGPCPTLTPTPAPQTVVGISLVQCSNGKTFNQTCSVSAGYSANVNIALKDSDTYNVTVIGSKNSDTWDSVSLAPGSTYNINLITGTFSTSTLGSQPPNTSGGL